MFDLKGGNVQVPPYTSENQIFLKCQLDLVTWTGWHRKLAKPAQKTRSMVVPDEKARLYRSQMQPKFGTDPGLAIGMTRTGLARNREKVTYILVIREVSI